MEQAILVFGILSAALITVGYIPQTLKTLKTRKTLGVSILMFLIVFLGCLSWIIFGALTISNIIATDNDTKKALITGLPILVSNALIGMMSFILFVIKISNVLKAKKLNLSEEEYMQVLDQKKQ